MRQSGNSGFTLVEMMLGAFIVAVVAAALIGAILGQMSLNLSARSLTQAMTDATRVMEEIRRQNSVTDCTLGIPTAKPPANFSSWEDWLSGAGKSIPTNAKFELCANFITGRNVRADATGMIDAKTFVQPIGFYYNQYDQTPFWNHGLGHVCFEREIKKELFISK